MTLWQSNTEERPQASPIDLWAIFGVFVQALTATPGDFYFLYSHGCISCDNQFPEYDKTKPSFKPPNLVLCHSFLCRRLCQKIVVKFRSLGAKIKLWKSSAAESTGVHDIFLAKPSTKKRTQSLTSCQFEIILPTEHKGLQFHVQAQPGGQFLPGPLGDP